MAFMGVHSCNSLILLQPITRRMEEDYNLNIYEAVMKKAIGIGVVVVLLALGGGYLYMNMGNIAKDVAEDVGTKTLGVKVSLASVDIDLKTRTVVARGLEIDNPDGYSTDHAMTVDTIQIALDSFSKELLTFTNINTTGTHIYVDAKESGMNLSDIRNGINARASAGKDVPEESRLSVIIRNLRMDDAVVHPAGLLANEKLAEFTMPSVSMKDIGANTKGVLVSEAMAQVTDQIVSTATRAAVKQGFLNGVNEEMLREIESSMGISGGVLEQIQTETENMGAKLRGMFQ